MNNGESKRTTNHETIKKWAEKREGKPAVVEKTESKDGSGLLRINFPGYAEENLKDISWEQFFKTFDENNLDFLYQEKTQDGKISRFSKFVKKQGS